MSLYHEYQVTCTLLYKTAIPDGAGGVDSVWSDGESFTAYRAIQSTAEQRKAEQIGDTELYSFLISSDANIAYNSIFKDTAGITYRVTTDPQDEVAPTFASFALKHFQAERWELTA